MQLISPISGISSECFSLFCEVETKTMIITINITKVKTLRLAPIIYSFLFLSLSPLFNPVNSELISSLVKASSSIFF